MKEVDEKEEEEMDVKEEERCQVLLEEVEGVQVQRKVEK